jgi:hypothetical protein
MLMRSQSRREGKEPTGSRRVWKRAMAGGDYRTPVARASGFIEASTGHRRHHYLRGALAAVRARKDELGRLAAVFEDMVGKLATQYDEVAFVW